MTTATSLPVVGLVLAGGKGTRMKSALPKVLHPIMGSPILWRVLRTLDQIGVTHKALVLPEDYGPFAELIAATSGLTVCLQLEQRGTGDAVAAAAAAFVGVKSPAYSRGRIVSGPPVAAPHILISYGDTPAVPAHMLRAFVQDALTNRADLAVVAMRCPNPAGYGRIVVNSDGTLARIVEERDASSDIKKIDLCNTGVLFARTDLLFDLLGGLTPTNAQREYYLTDCFQLAATRGQHARVFVADSHTYFEGINDRIQLANVERHLMEIKRHELMLAGATFILPETTYIEDGLSVEPDVIVEPGCVLRGRVTLGRGAHIGARSVLSNVTIGAGVLIGTGSVLVDREV